MKKTRVFRRRSIGVSEAVEVAWTTIEASYFPRKVLEKLIHQEAIFAVADFIDYGGTMPFLPIFRFEVTMDGPRRGMLHEKNLAEVNRVLTQVSG